MIVKLKMKILVRNSLESKQHACSIEVGKLRNLKGFFVCVCVCVCVSWHMTDHKIRERGSFSL